MNRYRIKLLFFFLIVISYSTASAQFRCGITFGGEVGFEILSKGYSNKNAIVGLRLEQTIFKKINTSFLGTVSSRYTIPMTSDGIVGYTKIHFNNYKGTFLLSYSPFKFIRLGGGSTLSYTPVSTQVTDSNYEAKFEKKRQEIGYLAILGFQYKPILMEFYYYQGKSAFIKYQQQEESSRILPLNTFGVSLNYLFTLSKTKK
jgi:hypothetical protein